MPYRKLLPFAVLLAISCIVPAQADDDKMMAKTPAPAMDSTPQRMPSNDAMAAPQSPANPDAMQDGKPMDGQMQPMSGDKMTNGDKMDMKQDGGDQSSGTMSGH